MHSDRSFSLWEASEQAEDGGERRENGSVEKPANGFADPGGVLPGPV